MFLTRPEGGVRIVTRCDSGSARKAVLILAEVTAIGNSAAFRLYCPTERRDSSPLFGAGYKETGRLRAASLKDAGDPSFFRESFRGDY